KIPSIYKDSGWQTLNHTVISTSNCGNPALRLFGFGPVVADGFGIGYIIKEEGIAVSRLLTRKLKLSDYNNTKFIVLYSFALRLSIDKRIAFFRRLRIICLMCDCYFCLKRGRMI